MNKKEMVEKVAGKGFSKANAAACVDAFVEAVTETLSDGGRVQIVGFGSFEVQERPPRTYRNPQTGKKEKLPRRKVPKFRPGKLLRDAVNQ